MKGTKQAHPKKKKSPFPELENVLGDARENW